MKKTIFAFIAFFAMLATPSQAQLNFGVKGGLNVSNMSFDSSVLDTENKAGFFIGPTVRFKVPLLGFGFDVAALYDQREADVKNSDGETETITQKSINVPINLRYTIGLGNLAGVYFAAGPQFGINIGDSDNSLEKLGDVTLKSTNLSVNLGAGVRLLNHLEIGAVYNIACGKTGEFDALGTVLDKGMKSNSWQISAAYYF